MDQVGGCFQHLNEHFNVDQAHAWKQVQVGRVRRKYIGLNAVSLIS